LQNWGRFQNLGTLARLGTLGKLGTLAKQGKLGKLGTLGKLGKLGKLEKPQVNNRETTATAPAREGTRGVEVTPATINSRGEPVT